MTEAVITGVASETVKIRTICGKLEIKMRTTDGSALDLDTPKFLVYVQNPKGGKRKTITDAVSIRKLMEIETLDPESCIDIYGSVTLTANLTTGVVTPAAVQHTMFGRVDIAPLVGLTLDGDDELYIEFTGLNATVGEYTVRTLEDSEYGPNYLNYSIQATENSKNRKFGLAGVNVLAIQRDNSLDSIELRYPNGHVVKMTPSEMDAHTRDAHGLVYNYQQVLGSFAIGDVLTQPLVQYVLNIHDAQEVQVNTSGSVSLEVILVTTQR